jgi:hypothetical protein
MRIAYLHAIRDCPQFHHKSESREPLVLKYLLFFIDFILVL